MEAEAELWFYVPDYLAVRHILHAGYSACGVWEHSAEPAHGGGESDSSADVIVRGSRAKVGDFAAWLSDPPICEGLQIAGKEVER